MRSIQRSTKLLVIGRSRGFWRWMVAHQSVRLQPSKRRRDLQFVAPLVETRLVVGCQVVPPALACQQEVVDERCSVDRGVEPSCVVDQLRQLGGRVVEVVDIPDDSQGDSPAGGGSATTTSILSWSRRSTSERYSLLLGVRVKSADFSRPSGGLGRCGSIPVPGR